jgi:hypothetical protein
LTEQQNGTNSRKRDEPEMSPSHGDQVEYCREPRALVTVTGTIQKPWQAEKA